MMLSMMISSPRQPGNEIDVYLKSLMLAKAIQVYMLKQDFDDDKRSLKAIRKTI